MITLFYKKLLTVLVFISCISTVFSYPHIEQQRENPVMQKMISFRDTDDLWKKYVEAKYGNRLIYIDTRDNDLYGNERMHVLTEVKRLAFEVEEMGGIFIPDPSGALESRKIINKILPDHIYSTNEGPFLIGQISSKKININNEEKFQEESLVINLSGMSKKCVSKYFQDIGQAIVRNKISDKKTQARWSTNSLVCEASDMLPEEYKSSIEKLWFFWRARNDNVSFDKLD